MSKQDHRSRDAARELILAAIAEANTGLTRTQIANAIERTKSCDILDFYGFLPLIQSALRVISISCNFKPVISKKKCTINFSPDCADGLLRSRSVSLPLPGPSAPKIFEDHPSAAETHNGGHIAARSTLSEARCGAKCIPGKVPGPFSSHAGELSLLFH